MTRDESEYRQIDEAVLALLHLTSFREKNFDIEITRAWKGHDWDALDRLHEKGGNPRGKAKSVGLTQEGKERAQKLFKEMFCES